MENTYTPEQAKALLPPMKASEREIFYLWAIVDYTVEEIAQLKQSTTHEITQQIKQLIATYDLRN
ncbi:hypothetical protein EOL70_04015 [Leucothrix sargassi]|nr:hypothetical protein EOL70_04015 [Leucothrix sargassi]